MHSASFLQRLLIQSDLAPSTKGIRVLLQSALSNFITLCYNCDIMYYILETQSAPSAWVFQFAALLITKVYNKVL